MKHILLPLIMAASTVVSAQTATTLVKSNVVTVACKSPALPVSPIANVSGVVTVTCALPTPPVVTLPSITRFTVSPSSVVSGGAVTVSYILANATSATASMGAQSGSVPATSYSVSMVLTQTTTFTLTATNKSGSVSKSVTATVTSAPPPTVVTGSSLTACGDITKSGEYTLENDVSSAGTCFGIDADGITLNLNGHTITYGTGGGNAPTPAIEGHDCWSTANPVDSGPCGSAHGGLEVYGGTIVQSPNSATFSPVFEFGQGTFSSAPYIHDITATFQNVGTQFYYSTYLPSGAKIENNTIHDNVTSINKPGQGDLSARSAFQGQAILIHNNTNTAGSGDVISGNTIAGSPQGGVRSDNQNTVIENNDISMNAFYSNDFCVDMPAAGQVFRGNNCHPKSGRGVHLNSANDVVDSNTIAVTELKQNAEYGGCEHGGTYGVQLEFDAFQGVPPTGAKVSDNTITATAGDCDAIGLRVTSTTSTGAGSFTGNVVSTTSTGAGDDYALSFDSADGTGITFTGNTFSSKDAFVGIDWDGASNFTLGANTWATAAAFTVIAGDGGCDPSQKDSAAACPISVELTDSLPDVVSCGSYSEASVTIDGKSTTCKAKK